MKIRKLIVNGEEQYVHSLPLITPNSIPEDVQDGEVFLSTNGWDVFLMVFYGGAWRTAHLSEATEK